MKTKRSFLVVLGLALLLALASGMMTGVPVPPQKDTLDVVAKQSTGGVTPTVPGQSSHEWFYAYCLPSGSSLNDTFPVDFTLNNTDGTTPESITVHLAAVGSPSLTGATTVPADFSISDNGVTISQSISVATGTLADGNYNMNIQISGTPANAVDIPHDTIHIQVAVGASCNPGSCFLTDSDFNYLLDCTGNEVTTSSGGTFAIVPNAKGKIVATNPGQFYYNLIWTNPGASQAVTINLLATNLNPMGANAVHALTFSSYGFTADASAFDMVNQDGTPCGPTGPCTITVGAGETLWVTWHLEYSQIGTSTSGLSATCSTTCPTNARNYISATGTLKDSSGSPLFNCTASACGYLKR